MLRMTRIVPTTVLTVAALALAAPVAQAKPLIAPSGGPNDVRPVVQSIQAAQAENVSPIVQSVHAAQVEKHRGVVVTTGDFPLANPAPQPQILKIRPTPVATPDSSGSSFDWTAAAVGAGLGGIVMLMLAGGVGFRRRGQLAA
jgi:hypothetical protein